MWSGLPDSRSSLATYVYERAGRMTSASLSAGGVAGPAVTLGFDANDRLTDIGRRVGTAGRSILSRLNNDAAGRLTAIAHADSADTAWGGDTPLASEANTAAMAFALAPDAADDWFVPLAWVDHALAVVTEIETSHLERRDDLRQVRFAYPNTRGAVLYRAGRFEQAAKGLRSTRTGVSSTTGCSSPLAEHRLGHVEAANMAAVRSRAVQPGSKPGGVWASAEVGLLAAEIDAMLPLHEESMRGAARD